MAPPAGLCAWEADKESSPRRCTNDSYRSVGVPALRRAGSGENSARFPRVALSRKPELSPAGVKRRSGNVMCDGGHMWLSEIGNPKEGVTSVDILLQPGIVPIFRASQ